MYSRNPLTRKILITPEEVIKLSPISDKVDPRQVATAIEIAEERFVRPVLGWDFYEDLVMQKNVVVDAINIAALQLKIDQRFGAGQVTLSEGDMVNALELMSASNQALWNERLWKFTAEAVRCVLIPENYVQLTSQGMVKHNPIANALSDKVQTSVGASLKDTQFLMDKWISDRLDPLESALQLYICRNISQYTKYDAARCPGGCGSGGDVQTRKVDWVTGIYDDDEEGRCCDW